MKKVNLILINVLVISSIGFGQTDEAAFFRLESPSNSVISEFDPGAGTINWSNGVAWMTNQLQRSVDLTATNGWVDYVMLVSTGSMACTERIIDHNPPEGMGFIPGGNYSMGDNLDGMSYAQPVHSVYVSGFYMGKTEVTKEQWDDVYTWAISNGYSFDHTGSGKAANHPVHTVSWYDVVKWCNARSEKEGKTPCYDLSTWNCNFNANGYRLPTEAEWEKAARGGQAGKRFPMGDTIKHSYANYYSSTIYSSYDTSSTRGYLPGYNNGGYPYTCPVGSFEPNRYGLYDIVGNVWEWCWDWCGNTYDSLPSSNPHGVSSGEYRAKRGGSWGAYAYGCRSAIRGGELPDYAYHTLGFRVVLSVRQ